MSNFGGVGVYSPGAFKNADEVITSLWSLDWTAVNDDTKHIRKFCYNPLVGSSDSKKTLHMVLSGTNDNVFLVNSLIYPSLGADLAKNIKDVLKGKGYPECVINGVDLTTFYKTLWPDATLNDIKS